MNYHLNCSLNWTNYDLDYHLNHRHHFPMNSFQFYVAFVVLETADMDRHYSISVVVNYLMKHYFPVAMVVIKNLMRSVERIQI